MAGSYKDKKDLLIGVQTGKFDSETVSNTLREAKEVSTAGGGLLAAGVSSPGDVEVQSGWGKVRRNQMTIAALAGMTSASPDTPARTPVELGSARNSGEEKDEDNVFLYLGRRNEADGETKSPSRRGRPGVCVWRQLNRWRDMLISPLLSRACIASPRLRSDRFCVDACVAVADPTGGSQGADKYASSENVQLIIGFFRSALRIKGVKQKLYLHQTAYFLIAFMEGFFKPLATRAILSFGLSNRSYKHTLAISLGALLWEIVRYHLKLNYFHGSMLVMQHLRAVRPQRRRLSRPAAMCSRAFLPPSTKPLVTPSV